MTRHYTSRELNNDLAGAKRAAFDGPVIVTDRGRPSHVLLNYDDYRRRLDSKRPSIVDLLSWPGLEDIDIDALIPPRTIDPNPFTFEDDG